MKHGKILSVTIRERGRYEDEPRIISVGDTYERATVSAIEVSLDTEARGHVYLKMKDAGTVTVLPFADIISYEAEESTKGDFKGEIRFAAPSMPEDETEDYM